MKFRILPDNIQSVTTIFNSKTTSISPKDFNVDFAYLLIHFVLQQMANRIENNDNILLLNMYKGCFLCDLKINLIK